ncbi:hypothetical protein BZG36_03629 [Bifiguratus adelaidae]|uniref:Tyrosyl-DNA phosphodiesterase 1 n=1 Tax=Bifiguratus adelaidae TaxID=1938954 RepID=A0A261Y0A0_9FUNG|nr:hypothetical protein BZG36_03629 [Bifiguratus adelaidae]
MPVSSDSSLDSTSTLEDLSAQEDATARSEGQLANGPQEDKEWWKVKKRPREESNEGNSISERAQLPSLNDREASAEVEYVHPGVSLTAVTELPDSENRGCMSLRDILYQGTPIKEMLQFNMKVDLEWFLAHLDENDRQRIPMTIVHGSTGENAVLMKELISKSYQNVKLVQPYLPVPYGTHHSKAMLLFFTDSTLQVVIHTANLVAGDWDYRTQEVWQSPRLHLKSYSESESYVPLAATSQFELDLIAYLRAYEHRLTKFIKAIQQYDFSPVRAVLIASTPGYHTNANMYKWGHMRLRDVLRRVDVGSVEDSRNDLVICQFSSIGSVPHAWFTDALGASLRSSTVSQFEPSMVSKVSGSKKRILGGTEANLKIVYPTLYNVRDSLMGWRAGGALPHDYKNWLKQKDWMMPYLHRWKGVRSGRDRASPHIKTYTRLRLQTQSKDDKEGEPADAEILWHLVTSANLSRAAWGDLQKNGTQFMVRSYELGVLIYPALWKNENEREIAMVNATRDNPKPTCKDQAYRRLIPIRLPYDLPLTPYVPGKDEAWTWDVSREEVDWLGFRWDGSR